MIRVSGAPRQPGVWLVRCLFVCGHDSAGFIKVAAVAASSMKAARFGFCRDPPPPARAAPRRAPHRVAARVAAVGAVLAGPEDRRALRHALVVDALGADVAAAAVEDAWREREGGVIRLRLYIRWEASAKPRLAIKQQQQQPKRQPRPAPPRAAPPRVSRSPPQPSGSGPHATLQVSLGVHGVTGGEHVAPSDEQL